MIEINLLPWRETKRLTRKRQFWVLMLFSFILAVIVLFLIYLPIGHWLSIQQERINYLSQSVQEETNQLSILEEAKSNKRNLINKINLIQALQNDRFKLIKFLDILPRVIPNQLYLTHIERTGHEILLEGEASSNQLILEFIQKLKSTEIFSSIQLKEVRKNINNTQEHQFILFLKEKSEPALKINDGVNVNGV